MAASGFAGVPVAVGRSARLSSPSATKGRPPTKMQARNIGVAVGVPRTWGPKSSLPARLSSGRVFAWQGVESAKEDISLLYPEMASSNSRQLEMFKSPRWSDTTRDELGMLNDSGESAREAFANRGEITELNMDRLVDALLREGGCSMEDYQRRAILFNHIAEFFRQGKAYTAEKDESADVVATMQTLVNSILAEDGRSAGDYNARAQFFAKSAEVFPFNVDVRAI